jgi:hypothetical protein
MPYGPALGHTSSHPASAWTAKANKRVQFGYGLNYRKRHGLDDRAVPVTGWSKRICQRHPERPPRNA